MGCGWGVLASIKRGHVEKHPRAFLLYGTNHYFYSGRWWFLGSDYRKRALQESYVVYTLVLNCNRENQVLIDLINVPMTCPSKHYARKDDPKLILTLVMVGQVLGTPPY